MHRLLFDVFLSCSVWLCFILLSMMSPNMLHVTWSRSLSHRSLQISSSSLSRKLTEKLKQSIMDMPVIINVRSSSQRIWWLGSSTADEIA